MILTIRDRVKQTSELSRQLLPSYQPAFTDIVVYLRTSPLEEAEAEEAIEDILELLLSAQERGEPVEAVLGMEVPQFCAEVVRSVRPRRFSWPKLFGQLSLLVLCAGVLWVNDLALSGLSSLLHGTPFPLRYGFTWAKLLSDLTCYIFAITLLHYIGQHIRMDRITPRNRIIVASGFILNLALLTSYSLLLPKTPLFTASLPACAVFFIGGYALCVWIKRRVER